MASTLSSPDGAPDQDPSINTVYPDRIQNADNGEQLLQPPAPTSRKGSPPRRGFFSSTPRTRTTLQQSAVPKPSSSSLPTFTPPANSLLSRVATNGTASTAPSTPEWQAARESVLSQMKTSDNVELPATVPRGRTGRGRGRGRGRGGRPPKIKLENVEPANGFDFGLTQGSVSAGGGRGSGRGRGRVNRGGRPRGSRGGLSRGGGVKKKRKHEDDDEKNNTDDSEVYAPLPTQSRSGRRITQANTFSPVVIDLEEKDQIKAPVITPTPKTIKNGKKPKRNYRKPGEAAVCKNCGRGHSPLSNMIVFCDGCNTPWHQYCHHSPIKDEVIRIPDKEWFCADCEFLRNEKEQWASKTSAETLSLSEKRQYLETLPTDRLVSLLLHATTLHPSLPIYGNTAIDNDPRDQGPDAAAERPTAEEEFYDTIAERELLPYPKAGHGISLPHELDRLAFLIDEDVAVYSHRCGWTEKELFGAGGRIDRRDFDTGILA